MHTKNSYFNSFPYSNSVLSNATWYNGEFGAMLLNVIKDDIQCDDVYFGFANMEGENGVRNFRIFETRGFTGGRPVLFGIAAYWIIHRSDSIKKTFEEYLSKKRKAYCRFHEKDANSWKRELEQEFYFDYIISKEIEMNQMSEEVFEYLSPEDNKKLKDVMDNFIEYISMKRQKLDTSKGTYKNIDHTKDKQTLSASKTFAALVPKPEKADMILKRLHELVKGKVQPKDITMPIRAAIDAGAISRPSWGKFCKEFGFNEDSSWKSAYSNYTNPNKTPYYDAAFDTMKNEFIKLIQ